jgi:hypothetical protein
VTDAALRAAAAATLAPLGFNERGHSGVFIADRVFWLAIVKLEDARITVGGHWLWYVQSRWCFDFGSRSDGADLALARRDAAALLARFDSLAAAARHLGAPTDEPWPLYHAAVAQGLAGDAAAAARFFARLLAKPAHRTSERDLRAAAEPLAALVGDKPAFRAAVAAIVERTRALQGLRALPIAFA